MKIKNKKIGVVLICVLMMLLMMTTLVYAVFYMEFKNIGIGGDSGKLDLKYDYSITDISSTAFTGPGSEIKREITLENTGSVPLKYRIYPILENDSGLSKAVLLYIDDVLIGNLFDLTVAPGKDESGLGFFKSPLYVDETIKHTLKLEYHIGASDFYDGKAFDLKIGINAESVTPQDVTFVTSEYDLRQVLKNSKYQDKTVVLTNDILLTETLEATNLINIDLNGHTINTDIYSINFVGKAAATRRIYSDKVGGNVVGEINVNTPNGLVLSKLPLIYENINTTLLATEYKTWVERVFNRPIENSLDNINETITDIGGEFKNFKFLLLENDSTSIDTNLWFTLSKDGQLIPKERDSKDRTIEFKLNLALNDTDFEANNFAYNEFFAATIRGDDDYLAGKTILTDNVGHLKATALDDTNINRQTIDTDIFLPIRALSHNATIEWLSSEPSILDTNGRFSPSVFAKEFELTAIVTFNNRTFVYTYYLEAAAMNQNERIKIFRLQNSPITFTNIGETHTLVTQDLKLGMTKIAYSMPVNVDGSQIVDPIFEMMGNQLTLVADPLKLKNAKIFFTVEGSANGENQYLDIIIDIAKTVSIFDAAYKFSLDYLSNEIQGRDEYLLSGFYLPTIYSKLADLKFEVLDSFTLPNGITYNNPAKFDKITNVSSGDNNRYWVELDPYSFLQDNTTVYLRLSITYNNETQYRAIPFNIAGILHNSLEDIEDISLYYALQQVFDKYPTDSFITRDEIESIMGDSNTEISVTNKGVESLKGLEYFNGLSKLYLNNNSIIDLSPLKDLVTLEILNLNNNIIANIAPLKNLIYLKNLQLENNFIPDISALSNMLMLETLRLTNNITLSDFVVIQKFKKLTTFTAINTNGAKDGLGVNENYFITSYQNAFELVGTQVLYFVTGEKETEKYVPSANKITANTVLNTIVPIYEFGKYIYLPYKVTQNKVEYPITWTTSHIDIISFSTSNQQVVATINQPISDINVKLFAQVTVNGSTVTRVIRVKSLGGENDLTIETSSGVWEKAEDIIPDSILRYELFKEFDENPKDNKISIAERTTGKDKLNLSGINIAKLDGLRLFPKIKNIDLTNNPKLKSLSELSDLAATLVTLYIDGTPNYSELYGLTKLTQLYVYGSTNVLEEESLNQLFILLKNSLESSNSNKIEIFKDNLITKWNPYAEAIAQVITTVESYYKLSYGGASITLPTSISAKIYGKIETFALTYEGAYNSNYSFDKTSGVLSYTKGNPSKNIYERLKVSIQKYGIKVERGLTVIILAESDYYFKKADGTLITMLEAFPNAVARGIALSKYNNSIENGKKIITQNDISKIDNITFSGNPCDIKGLEYLSTVNLTTLTIEGYRPMGVVDGLKNAIQGFTKITNLTLNRGVYDLRDIETLTNLSTLVMNNNISLTLDYAIDTDTFGSTLSKFGKLTELKMTNSNINDFRALSTIVSKNLKTLHIFGNPASSKAITNQYVGSVYEKQPPTLTLDYQVLSSGAFWTGVQMGDVDAKINGTVLAKNTIYKANYLSSTDYVILPKKNFKGYDLEWVSSSPDALEIVAEGAGFKCYVRNASKYKNAYVIVKGKINGLPAIVEYVFVIKGIASQNIVSGVLGIVDLTLFMLNPEQKFEFADPYFANYALGLITKGNFGIYYGSNSITTISLSANGKEKLSGFKNIKGIEIFSNVREINLGYHVIEDLSPMYNLTYNNGLGNTTLKSVNFDSNKITKLHLDNGDSVFKYAHGIESIHLWSNDSIENYLPLAYKDINNISDSNLRVGLLNLKTVWIGTYNVKYYEDPLKHLGFVIPWSTNVISDKTLNAFGADTLANDKINTLQLMVKDIKDGKFTQPAITEIGGGVALAAATLAGVALTYTTNQNSSTTLVTISGNKIISTTAEAKNIPMKVPLLAYTDALGSRIYFATSVQLSLNNDSSVETEKTKYLIEMTEPELTVRGLGKTSSDTPTATNPIVSTKSGDTTVYNASAYYMIPDDVLRAYCFQNLNNETDKKETITIAERTANRSYTSIENRGIKDISGIDLFYNISSLKASNNYIRKIPKMYLPANNKLVAIDISGNAVLTDLSNLVFDGDREGTAYVSLSQKITTLNLQACYGVNNDAIKYIGQCANMQTLNFYGLKMSDMDGLKDLRNLKEVNNLSKRMIYNYNNFEVWRRLYLNSTNAIKLGDLMTNADFPKNFIWDHVVHNGEYTDGTADTSESYIKGKKRKLPKQFNLNGYTYPIAYAEETSAYYIITYNANAKCYEIEILDKTDTPTTLDIPVTVGVYPEKLTITISGGSNDANEDTSLEGWIQIEEGGEFVDLKSKVPDEYMRKLLLQLADANKDKQISYEELGKRTELILEFGVNEASDLEGIQYLRNLTELDIRDSSLEYFEPLFEMKNVTKLTIRGNKVQVMDTQFLVGMTSLEFLDFFMSPIFDFSGLEKLSTLQTLRELKLDYGMANTLYARNSIAFQELFGKLTNLELGLTKSTKYQKEASLILNEIKIPMPTLNGTNYTSTLPSTVMYNGINYPVTYTVFNSNAKISNDILNIVDKRYNQIYLVAKIIIERANATEAYERLIKVNI